MSDEDPFEDSVPDDWTVLGPFRVLKEPDWMTGTDLQIIDALGRGLTLSPTIISDNTDKSREAISRRLSTLQAAGYVEKTGRGRYEITEKGMEFLEGRVLPNDDDWAINPDDDRANEENGE